MRAGLLLLLVSAACNSEMTAAPGEPTATTVRERLTAGETRLLLAGDDSGGTLTAYRRIGGGDWEAGVADLAVDQGELVLAADGDGAVTIERFSLTLAPITIPAGVFGHEAVLTDVRAVLAGPALATTAWTSDDAAHATAELDLAFSWALRVDGNTTPLGAPDFPPIAVELDLGGAGGAVHATVHAAKAGVVWSWADLVRLEDFDLTVTASTR